MSDTIEHLQRYIDWYENDVIPGFERQAELNHTYIKKTGEFIKSYTDAIRRAKKHRGDLLKRMELLNGEKQIDGAAALSHHSTEEADLVGV